MGRECKCRCGKKTIKGDYCIGHHPNSRSNLIRFGNRFRFKKGTKLWLGKKHSKTTKEKISENSKKMWRNPKIRKKLEISHKKIMNNKKVKEKIAKSVSKLWKNKKWRENQIKKRLGKPIWNKGLSSKTDERVRKSAEKSSKTIKENFKKGILKPNKGAFKEGDIRIIGENNCNFNNYSSYEPYGIEFNNKFKRLIRKRDNYICMLCNKHQEKLSQTLCIHHINYDKKLSIPQNCISLCNSCHTKTNYNRKHWIKFFQSILSEKYNYKYENGKILLGVK